MLNQLTMDRGPASSYPADKCAVSNNNCWAAGNAGEMDFLEPPWNKADASATNSYRDSYSTQFNQIGRCFNGGVNGGGFNSDNYLLTASPSKPETVIYVAVVDSVGNWVYRLPADKAESIWLVKTTTRNNAQLSTTTHNTTCHNMQQHNDAHTQRTCSAYAPFIIMSRSVSRSMSHSVSHSVRFGSTAPFILC